MTERAACAHLCVSWRTKQIEGGLTTGWWECDSGCGMRFTTVPHAVDLHFQAAPPPDVTALVAKWKKRATKLTRKADAQDSIERANQLETRADTLIECADDLDAWATAQ